MEATFTDDRVITCVYIKIIKTSHYEMSIFYHLKLGRK